MSYYDVAIGGVTDDGTSYLQVGRNDKSFRFCLLDSLWKTITSTLEILANEPSYFEV